LKDAIAKPLLEVKCSQRFPQIGFYPKSEVTKKKNPVLSGGDTQQTGRLEFLCRLLGSEPRCR